LLRPNKKELRLRLRVLASIERTGSKRPELLNSREKSKNASLPKKDVSKPKLPNNKESSVSLMRDVELSQPNVQKNCAKKSNVKMLKEPAKKQMRELKERKEQLLSRQPKNLLESREFVRKQKLRPLVRKLNALRKNVLRLSKEPTILKKKQRLKRKLDVNVNSLPRKRNKWQSELLLEKLPESSMSVKSSWLRNELKLSSVRRPRKLRLVKRLKKPVNVPSKNLLDKSNWLNRLVKREYVRLRSSARGKSLKLVKGKRERSQPPKKQKENARKKRPRKNSISSIIWLVRWTSINVVKLRF
jgi:hypothetical protein